MPHKPPTIRDIAREAGVSISAVSHAFNRPDELSPDVRERILQLAKDRGYRADPRARGLRRNESSLIALLISDLANPFNAALAKTVQRAIGEHGYYLVVLNSGTREDERRSLEAVVHERMAGAIVPAYYLMPDELRRQAMGRPVVLITDTHESFAGPTIRLDNFAAAYTATTYLASKGRRRIAHITGQLDTPPGFRRCAGYRQALEDLGLGPPIEMPGNFNVAHGQGAIEALLSMPQPPDAVFAANDLLAFAALRLLRERHITVPDEIAVVGLDNIEDAAWSIPPLTTISQPIEHIGATAANLLMSRLKDPHFAEIVDVPYTLVERSSV